MLSGLFGQKASQATQPQAASGVSVQSSVYGQPLKIVYGTTRVPGNMMLYGNFTATPTYSTPASTGKGGGGNSSSSTISGYTYTAAFAFALSEGPIQGIGNVWQAQALETLASHGLNLFTGTYPQTPWGTTVTWSVIDANNITTAGTSTPLGYNGVAYVAASSFALGNSASVPNLTYEVFGIYSNSVPGQVDADPSLVLTDILTNPHYGAGFPATRLANLANWQNYCLSAGLLISPCYDTQTAASSILDELCAVTNSAAVWSSGQLTVVPYGDTPLNGNGKSYNPPSVPLYNLTDDDFQDSPSHTGSSSSSSTGPVLLTRIRPADKLNSVKLEYLDRSNNYNPAIIYANDQALIDTFGLRTNGSKQTHLLCNATTAALSANLQLRRQHICNTYQFDLDQRYSLLDPMDIVSITDVVLGLNQQWVRITWIEENDVGTLSFTAEEYLAGTGNAPAYSFAQGAGYSVNINATPPSINPPILFEPPDALAGGLQIWCALSGSGTWGGCDIYSSTDGNTHEFEGRVTGDTRMGTLTSSLASVTPATTPPTIDVTNTLAVSLAESNGALLSASQAQTLALNTLCYVDGEYIAYQTATLIGASAYNLTYLVRGCYGTAPVAHAIGSGFARLDSNIFVMPFTQDRIGQTIYLKFCSFNQYGGGTQSLGSVPTYTYVVKGTALASPLPNVTNLITSFVANISSIDWSDVSDFRPVLYEVRKGASWTGAQVLGRVAHPPFRTQGDGTYWVAAYSQPTAGLNVYSGTPTSLALNGSTVTQNIIVSHEEDPTWSGTLTGSVAVVGSTVQTTGIAGGQYTIPTADRIFLTSPAACQVLITWTSTGAPVNATLFNYSGNGTLINGAATITGMGSTANIQVGNIIQSAHFPVGTKVLSVNSSSQITADHNATASITETVTISIDFENTVDLFGNAAAINANVYPEIRLSQNGGSTWSAWQRYVSGSYLANGYDARMQILTSDAGTTAILDTMKFAVDVPDRDDHYNSFSVGTGGTTLTFAPDGGSAAAFNGGPQGSGTPGVPHIQGTVLNASAGDDLQITSITLTSCFVKVVNGGAGVARLVNIIAQGY
jgi:hypothetical protein